MNKEEILERSRKEKPDEGFLFIMNKASVYGIRVFCLIMICLIVFTFITWRICDAALLLTILWCFLSSFFEGVNKEVQHKNRGLVLVSCVITLICFISYINLAFFS